MPDQHLVRMAEQLAAGEISLDRFLQELTRPKTADLGDTQLDLDRRRRCGYPEVTYGEGKEVATLERIFRRQLADGIEPLATRINPQQAAALNELFPEGKYNAVGRTYRVSVANSTQAARSTGRVVVVSAGTTDRPVAEEAYETAHWMGADVVLIQDIGVAGPQRLIEQLPIIQQAAVVVVVAGMEGALPSVVAGHVACPVIAVPTSVGYGASFGGMAALLAMLNSCAANVTVVNIDAGFKAGYVAGLIAGKQTT